MKKCALCGEPVDSGLVIHSECVLTNKRLRQEADQNAALAMEAKVRADKLGTESAELRAALKEAGKELALRCDAQCLLLNAGCKDFTEYFLKRVRGIEGETKWI